MTDLERLVACAISDQFREQWPEEYLPQARRAVLAVAHFLDEADQFKASDLLRQHTFRSDA